ncbi:MAG: hypothetical protein MN733_08675 [Nitrososphaera sp.]|nr:hypothetical protein [Nitrososphaera sp.]
MSTHYHQGNGNGKGMVKRQLVKRLDDLTAKYAGEVLTGTDTMLIRDMSLLITTIENAENQTT